MRVWLLLHQNPLRYSAQDLAERFEVTSRTIYRDLMTLSEDIRVPVYSEKGRWAVQEDYYLPPIRLAIPEALHVFLAVRLMARFDHHYNPYVDSTFRSLGSILPEPLKAHIQRTLDWMHSLPKDEKHLRVLRAVAEAWASRRQLKIFYRALDDERPTERIIAPYHIEPAAPGHASYVIAHCYLRNATRVFKIERIESAVLLNETYAIPDDFDPDAFLGSAWGIIVEGPVQKVRLRINDRAVMRLMTETIWHPSQTFEKQRDGSTIMTLEVMNTVELCSWILGWGDAMEVLSPPELRQRVAEIARAITLLYAPQSTPPKDGDRSHFRHPG